MSLPPFQLKRPLGRSYRVDLDDSRRTKEALQRLGYFETPSYGLTDYPDEQLFKAIEKFQDDNDLAASGIVRPDDDTAGRLGQMLAELPLSAGNSWRQVLDVQDFPRSSVFGLDGDVGDGRRNSPDDVLNTKRALSWAGFLPPEQTVNDDAGADDEFISAIRGFQEAKGLEPDGWMHPGGETEWHLAQEIAPKITAQWADDANGTGVDGSEQGTQVAQSSMPIEAPLIPGAAITGAAGLAGALGVMEMMRKQGRSPIDGLLNGRGPMNPDQVPPPEVPHKEEFPAAPPDIPQLEGRPVNHVLKNDPLIFESVSDELRKSLEAPLESSRGDEKTQEGNRRIIQICQEEFEAWGPEAVLEHIGGSYKNGDPDGEYLKEKYFQDPEAKGTKGSSNVDVSLRGRTIADGPSKQVHMNSGEMLDDGETPIASERRQLVKLAQNLAKQVAQDLREATVGFIQKLRPGMDEDEWEDRVRRQCRATLTDAFGPPQPANEGE